VARGGQLPRGADAPHHGAWAPVAGGGAAVEEPIGGGGAHDGGRAATEAAAEAAAEEEAAEAEAAECDVGTPVVCTTSFGLVCMPPPLSARATTSLSESLCQPRLGTLGMSGYHRSELKNSEQNRTGCESCCGIASALRGVREDVHASRHSRHDEDGPRHASRHVEGGAGVSTPMQ
jgi:hypothetical protein